MTEEDLQAIETLLSSVRSGKVCFSKTLSVTAMGQVAKLLAEVRRLQATNTHDVKFINRTISDNPKEYKCPYCEQHFVVYDKHRNMDLPYCGNCGRAILDAADDYCGGCGEKLKWPGRKYLESEVADK